LHGPDIAAGTNPFDTVAFIVDNDQVRFKEIMTSGWKPARDVGSTPLNEVAYILGNLTNHTFSSIFPIYVWDRDDGYNNIGEWIETAATQAGR
jgi:hypothetical protein